MLKVVWDLRVAPITFDFAIYLAIVECFRQLRNEDSGIDITIRADEFRMDTHREKVMPTQEKRWRLKNIILDLCELLPTIKSLTLTSEDRGPFDYPPEYASKNRIVYAAKRVVEYHKWGANPIVLKAPAFAAEVTSNSISKPYVTLTLRTSRFLTARNVDHHEWYRFYSYLRSHGHKVVIVPDQEDYLGDRTYRRFDWDVYEPACMDIRLRLALYENAIMNVGSSNGPVGAMFYSIAPVLQFDQLRGAVYDPAFWRRTNGFEVGQQYPWSGPNQRMTWTDSTFDNMRSEWQSLGL